MKKYRRSLVFLIFMMIASMVFWSYADLKKQLLAPIMFYEANQLYRNTDYGDAGIMYERIISGGHVSAATTYNVANTYFQQGRYLEAIKIFKELVCIEPGQTNANAWNNLGLAYYRVGLLHQSTAAFKTAVLLAPKDQEIRQNLVWVIHKIKQQEEALANKKKKAAPGEEIAQKRPQEKKGERSQSADASISTQEMESLLAMVAQNEEMKKAKIGMAKRKPGPYKANEKDY